MSTSVAQKKSAYLSWGVECELKVSMSLLTPLHSSQIIDLPPPPKKIVLLLSIIFAVMLIDFPMEHFKQQQIAYGFMKKSTPRFICCVGCINGM